MKRPCIREVLEQNKNQEDMFPSIPSQLKPAPKKKWAYKKGDQKHAHHCDFCKSTTNFEVVRTYGDMMKIECVVCRKFSLALTRPEA